MEQVKESRCITCCLNISFFYKHVSMRCFVAKTTVLVFEELTV